MTTYLVLLNVAVMAALFGLLVYMKRKNFSFSKRVFAGLGLGIIYGFILQYAYEPNSETVVSSLDWFTLASSGYIIFLKMMIMPLVFISILSAFTKLNLAKNAGKISGVIIGLLIATTAVSAAVGIASAAGFDLKMIQIDEGAAETARLNEIQGTLGMIKDKTIPQHILSLLPANPFLDFTGTRPTSTIAVVVFAAVLGIAFVRVKKKNEEQAESFKNIVDSFYNVIMKAISLILSLTPYGVLAIMTKTVALSDLGAIEKMGVFVLASYAALIVMFGIHLLMISFSGLSPVIYMKKAFAVLSFAFTSRTSAGALPLNVRTQKSLGVPDGIANLAGTFGLSIGQNGCAGIYPAMLAIIIAPTVGVDPLSLNFIVSLIVIIAISSFGVAGVGGGATFAALLVLSAMNLPIALVGLLISVEPIIDMGRTALNVSGAMTTGIITSKLHGQLDIDAYNDPQNTAGESA